MSGSLKKLVSQPVDGVRGTICVPGDKSMSHRALLFGAIATGKTVITGFLAGEDCLATLAALREMSVDIVTVDATTIEVHGAGMRGLTQPQGALNMGNSGTAMRLFAGLLAGQPFTASLIGDDSLSARPMERVAIPLREMGASVETTDGHAPLRIAGGKLEPLQYQCPVASAQLKSAILIAGLYANGTTQVTEPGVTRDHTERMLSLFGAEITSLDKQAAVVGPAELRATQIQVPGDLSSAAFVIALALLRADDQVTIKNVGINPTRTGVLEILQLMGARIEVQQDNSDKGKAQGMSEPTATLIVKRSDLRGVKIPPELVPLAIDELPIVFALAACANGTTEISGAEELRHKESDRIAAMAKGLRNLGIEVEEHADGALIHGGVVNSGTVDSEGDHRIAMSFAVLATVADGPVEINDTANVATSFPNFVSIMTDLGMAITETNIG